MRTATDVQLLPSSSFSLTKAEEQQAGALVAFEKDGKRERELGREGSKKNNKVSRCRRRGRGGRRRQVLVLGR
jgi:hypothetical protein